MDRWVFWSECEGGAEDEEYTMNRRDRDAW